LPLIDPLATTFRTTALSAFNSNHQSYGVRLLGGRREEATAKFQAVKDAYDMLTRLTG
jgi:hypothetical protein